MSLSEQLEQISPETFASLILLFGILFGILWFLDHQTHLRIWKKDIKDGELLTHRLILYASYGLMAALFLMAWWPLLALPLFLGCWITRTTQEAIDEFRWHVDRCTEYESLLHLFMWITIHAGTAITFMWGFFLQFKGIGSLPIAFHLVFAVLFVFYSYIGQKELTQYNKRLPGTDL